MILLISLFPSNWEIWKNPLEPFLKRNVDESHNSYDALLESLMTTLLKNFVSHNHIKTSTTLSTLFEGICAARPSSR